jgi:hypothetical protein
MQDDQNAHLDMNQPKVLKYIGADSEHNFMKNISVSQELVHINYFDRELLPNCSKWKQTKMKKLLNKNKTTSMSRT